MKPNTKGYFQYLAQTAEATKNQAHEIEALKDILLLTRNNGGRVFIIGNGGSAATADHFVCDFTKNAGISTISLQGTAMITALANDINYDMVYKYQLEKIATPHDLLIAISTSGNSPNIVNAVNYAKRSLMKVATLTAFNGGIIRGRGDVNIHIDTDIIEIAEDLHTAVLHSIVWSIKRGL